MHMDPEDESSWTYEGTCQPPNSAADSVPTEIGGADRLCRMLTGNSGAYIILWQCPLAFAADAEPKGLEDAEGLSGASNPGTVPAAAPVPVSLEADEEGDAAYMALCSGAAGVSSNPEIVFPSADTHDVGVPPANPGLRKLTKAQSKRLISGVTEVIAGDAVLRSIAYNTALSGVSHLILKLKDHSVQALSEEISKREAGPPGLVVARLPAPTEELCLELECLADTVSIPIVIISPNEYPQLEDAVRLRGDLNISGAGPNISKALDILQAWSESYGYIPRSYEDTETDDFWKVCNDVSEEFYIDAFSRMCFVGDDQDH